MDNNDLWLMQIPLIIVIFNAEIIAALLTKQANQIGQR